MGGVPPLVDKFININLNVQDPNYSAVYGNPYLRAGDTLNYRDTYDQNFLTDEPLVTNSLYRPTTMTGTLRHSPPETNGTLRPSPPGGAVDAKYIIRQDLLSSSLATHV